jgi:hypothetical protein
MIIYFILSMIISVVMHLINQVVVLLNVLGNLFDIQTNLGVLGLKK